MARPQTIQIFLPSGDPRGMRIAEITTRIVRVIEVPRSRLNDFIKLPESQQVGVYFLVGDISEIGLPRVYIGQSGNIGNRLVQHNKNKDFWNRALVVISLTNNMTQTHALFLEWFAIAEATKAERYGLENGNTGARPHTPLPLEADCHEIFETASILLSTLGQPIFESLSNVVKVQGESPDESQELLFYCKSSDAEGVGEYTNEGFVIHKDSKGRMQTSDSFDGSSNAKLRNLLQAEGVLVPEGKHLKFSRDYLFPSPSTASSVLLGRSSNGWVEWKSTNNKTLDELKRQTSSSTPPSPNTL